MILKLFITYGCEEKSLQAPQSNVTKRAEVTGLKARIQIRWICCTTSRKKVEAGYNDISTNALGRLNIPNDFMRKSQAKHTPLRYQRCSRHDTRKWGGQPQMLRQKSEVGNRFIRRRSLRQLVALSRTTLNAQCPRLLITYGG